MNVEQDGSDNDEFVKASSSSSPASSSSASSSSVCSSSSSASSSSSSSSSSNRMCADSDDIVVRYAVILRLISCQAWEGCLSTGETSPVYYLAKVRRLRKLKDDATNLPLVSETLDSKTARENEELQYIDCKCILANNVAFWPKPIVTIQKSHPKNEADDDDDDDEDVDNGDEIVKRKDVRLTFAAKDHYAIIEHNQAEFNE